MLASTAYAQDHRGYFFRELASSSASSDARWVDLISTGTWKGYDEGEFSLSPQDFDNFIALHAKSGIELALNYDHERREAAGWFTEFRVEDGRLQGLLRLNTKGLEQVRNEVYKYTSVEIDFKALDEVSGEPVGPRLMGVALTNYPFFKGQKPLEFSDPAQRSHAMNAPVPATQPAAAPAQPAAPPPEVNLEAEGPGDEAKMAAGMEALAMLRQIVGADESADDASVLSMIQEKLEVLMQAMGQVAEEGTPADAAASEQIPLPAASLSEKASKAEMVKAFRSLEAANKALSEQLNSLLEDRRQRELQALESQVDSLIAEGRFPDAQREHLVWVACSDNAQFEKLVQSTPKPEQGRRALAPPRSQGKAAETVSLSELDGAERAYAERMVRLGNTEAFAVKSAKERAHLYA